MAHSETERLAELIGKKHECLTGLRDLGRRQLDLVHSGEMTQLLKVLSAKGHLIGLLQQIEKGLEPFRHQDPERRSWPSAEDRRRCAQQAAACQQLLAEVMEQEKQSEHVMRSRRDETAEQLSRTQTADQARRAYVQEDGPRSGMLDVTSDT